MASTNYEPLKHLNNVTQLQLKIRAKVARKWSENIGEDTTLPEIHLILIDEFATRKHSWIPWNISNQFEDNLVEGRTYTIEGFIITAFMYKCFRDHTQICFLEFTRVMELEEDNNFIEEEVFNFTFLDTIKYIPDYTAYCIDVVGIVEVRNNLDCFTNQGNEEEDFVDLVISDSIKGINSIVGAVAVNMGVVTTPQLHWMVRATNKGTKASEQDYCDQLISSFRCLLDLIPEGGRGNNKEKLIVDAANGVGGVKLEVIKKSIHGLNFEVRNTGKEGVLNDGVGADFVQKEKVTPYGFGPADVGIRCASLDGDADRLVYFTALPNCSGKIELVDGDKILSLFALFIKEQLSILEEANNEEVNSYQAHLGVVQTAYANGASTDYLKQTGLEVVLTPTGVKYLHEKAADFDIGIYFEANGHGTILFSSNFLTWLDGKVNELGSTAKGSEQLKAALRLLAVSKLINQAVGDALSGLFLVEAILQHKGWSINKWNELYNDLPSRQLKVKVVDRTAVVTANAETEVVRPPGIQEAINMLTAKYPRGRCFIRPSGTEDVVRVYAEASTQQAADDLASSVAKLTDQFLESH